MSQDTPPRRRHLMDPDALGRPRDYAQENRNLSRVQQWVMSALAVTTIGHLAFGLVVAAMYLDAPRPGARVGLCVIAAAFGVIAIAIARIIHKRPPVSPWLVIGLIPGIIGIWLINR